MNAVVRNGYSYPTLLETFFGKDAVSDRFAPAFTDSTPAINVLENEDGYRIEVAAPGMQKSDFKLDLNHNHLTISARKEQNEEQTNEKYTRREFRYASFQRTFTLPTSIDPEKVQATYTDGILGIELPRREEARVKPSRQIEIR
jgi:HSP20 family protein